MTKLFLAAVAASFLATGCAAPQTTASAAAERDDGDVVTGSRIKRKDNPQATKVIIQDDASRAEITRGAAQKNPSGG